jgi:hypothetical protein
MSGEWCNTQRLFGCSLDLRDDLQTEEAQLTSEATPSQSSIPKLFIMTILT